MGDAVTLVPGIHDGIAGFVYHADEIDETPSLSASIANILVNKSPAHARAAHPKLTPSLERTQEPKFDVGNATHSIFLEGVDRMQVVYFDDWKKQAAKDARDAARSEGKIPLLERQADEIMELLGALRGHLATLDSVPALFSDGKPEQTLVWRDERDVLCRARLDWLHDDYSAIDDLKTTSASADPRKWERTMYGMGADLQVAFYMRGVERLTGIRPSFRYVVVETYPPYELGIVDLAPSALALAEDKVETAIALWATCAENDDWPGYARRVASIELPTWEELRWLDREQETAA